MCHEEAVEKIITLPATIGDVGELLSSAHAQVNRHCLLKIIFCLRFLSRQIRGHGGDSDGNIFQLLKLKGEEDKSKSQL